MVVDNKMGVGIYQGRESVALMFVLEVVNISIVVGMLGGGVRSNRDVQGVISVILLDVGGIFVDVYRIWDVDVVWKCLIDGNGTMVAYRGGAGGGK